MDIQETIQVEITEELLKLKRLDKVLVEKVPSLSRNVIKNLFENGHINCDTAKLELKKIPPVGTVITVDIPEPEPSDAQPENIPLEIMYQDEHLVIVNKPAGMVTHPAPGNYTGTLVNAILYHCPDLKGVGDIKRPGIVHRLDKGTSGVMVIAKTPKCHEGLVNLFSTHDIVREYECLIMGIKYLPNGTLKSHIGRDPNNRLKMANNVRNAKHAITHYKVQKFYENVAHAIMTLETGRTHQIRVHLSGLLKSPILCDETYGNPKQQMKRIPAELAKVLKDYPYPLLHARKLGFIHPITKEELIFEKEPPQIFREALDVLNKTL
ncbi:MAG: RluA family pseudouridine synthase [Oligoflexia bacterium]|nr:RluA family pseudouridine synthase [Oligoflexia bacterium]